MRVHVKLLAWIHLVLGGLGCLVGLILFIIFSFMGRRVPLIPVHGHPFFRGIGVLGILLVGLCLLFSLPGLLAGYGLLNYKPWARILTLILCFVNLLNIPLGTVLGLYGLWVLLSREGEQFYQRQSAI